MASEQHNSRPNRESLSKRLGKVAQLIKARDGNACVYCGATEASSKAHLHLDHLQPKAHGGADVATNLVVACINCNSSRKDKTLREWAKGKSFTAASIRAQARKAL